MILIDSSIWIDHLRHGNPHLVQLLAEQRVVQHPCITAELALGSLAQRERFLAGLRAFPAIAPLSEDGLLAAIDRAELHGSGVGHVDAQLIASTLATPGARLWTSDKRLAAEAGRLGCAYQPPA